MKHASAKEIAAFVVLLSFLTLPSPVARAFEGQGKKRSGSPAAQDAVSAPSGSMSIWQARKAVIAGLQRVVPNDFLLTAPSKIKIDSESIEFFAAVSPVGGSEYGKCPVPGTPSGSTYKVDLKRVGTFGVAGSRVAGYARRRDSGAGLLIDGMEPHFAQRSFGVTCSSNENTRIWGILSWSASGETRSFVDAMNLLRAAARGGGGSGQEGIWNDFHKKAAAWRALPSKPQVPEEVRRHRLVAESSIREKDFDTAVGAYVDGLASYPEWPEGHFNAALLSAELGYYSESIRHMQAYLELVPEAPDAQSARDQIVIWQSRMNR